jgi:hypothetical protein
VIPLRFRKVRMNVTVTRPLEKISTHWDLMCMGPRTLAECGSWSSWLDSLSTFTYRHPVRDSRLHDVRSRPHTWSCISLRALPAHHELEQEPWLQIPPEADVLSSRT